MIQWMEHVQDAYFILMYSVLDRVRVYVCMYVSNLYVVELQALRIVHLPCSCRWPCYHVFFFDRFPWSNLKKTPPPQSAYFL